MKGKILVSIIILSIILNACSSSKLPEGVWVNKDRATDKTYSSLFIVVMTADIEARVKLESSLAAAAMKKGFKAVKSVDVMPGSLKDPKVPEKDSLVIKVKASGCDAVLISSLLKKGENIGYTPGTTVYAQMPDYTWSGSYFGYYTYWAPLVSQPSYYTNDKNYLMQTNLYDAASGEIMWSVQSQILNPSSLKDFSKTYTADLISKLQKGKILKK